jgi:hypothetical protein
MSEPILGNLMEKTSEKFSFHQPGWILVLKYKKNNEIKYMTNFRLGKNKKIFDYIQFKENDLNIKLSKTTYQVVECNDKEIKEFEFSIIINFFDDPGFSLSYFTDEITKRIKNDWWKNSMFITTKTNQVTYFKVTRFDYQTED